jgi:hypothetical protein
MGAGAVVDVGVATSTGDVVGTTNTVVDAGASDEFGTSVVFIAGGGGISIVIGIGATIVGVDTTGIVLIAVGAAGVVAGVVVEAAGEVA